METLAICHIVMVLAVYWYVRRQGDAIQAAAEAMVVFLMPVAGFVVVVGTRIVKAIKPLQCNIDPHKLMNQNSVFTNMISYDENVIPLHDTYLMEDVTVKRKIFLDAVKQNVLENHKVLKMATYDQDREIAYYAVSMISGRIEELEDKINHVESELVHDKDNMALQKEHAKLLKEYLAEDFIDQITRKDRTEQYVAILAHLLQKEPQNMEYLQEKIRKEINLKNFAEAQKLCEHFQQLYPEREEPYLEYIKLFFYMRQIENLQKKIDELKAIPGELSLKALEVVRYWGGSSRE